MKKPKYSKPYSARDYFSTAILPSTLYGGRKTIRQQIPYRQHEETEFLLVRSGTGAITVNARSFPVQRGSLLCFSPGHFHKLSFPRGSQLEVSECHVNSGVYFYIAACPYYHSHSEHPQTPPLLAQLDEAHTCQVTDLIDRLVEVCEKTPVQENQPAFFLLMKLFGILEQYACSPSPEEDPKTL